MCFLTNMVVFVFSDWYYYGRQIHQKTRKKNLSEEKWIIIIIIIKEKARKRIKPHVGAQPVDADEQLLHCSRCEAPLLPPQCWEKNVGLCVMEHTVTMWISRFDLTHTSHFVRSEFICIKRSESRNWIQSHRSLSCMWWIFWYPVLMQGLKL